MHVTPEDLTNLPPLSDYVADTVLRSFSWVTARPWLAAVLAAVLLPGAAIRMYWQQRRAEALNRDAHHLTITPPPQVDPAGAAVFWSTLAELTTLGRRRRWRYGRAHVGLEYRWSGRRLTISLWVPGIFPLGPIEAAIRGAWPGAAYTAAEATAPLPHRAIVVGGTLRPAMPGWYPLRSDHDNDPMRTLLAAAGNLHPTDNACVQVLARPASRAQRRRMRHAAAALRTGKRPARLLDPNTWLRLLLDLPTELLGHRTPARNRAADPALLRTDPQRDRDARAAIDKLFGPQWEVSAHYAVASTNPRDIDPDILEARLATAARGLAVAYGVWAGRNRLRRLPIRHPALVMGTRRIRRGFLLDSRELASIAGLPYDLAVPGLDRARAKPMPAPVDVPAGGRGTKALGRAEVGGHAVAVPVADARQHTHIIGSTGSGKSTLMLNMIEADIRARRGTVVIDPKGDLILDVLDRIPADMADRVVIIDPDQDPGAVLNPLAGDDHDLVVDNIVSIFSKIFTKHWGPRIDDVLRVSCLTLLRKANATLTLVPPLLNDKQFRAMFTSDLDDPAGLGGFWEWFESTPPPLRAQIIGPVLARLRAFLLRDFVRRTLGAPRSSFDMRRILDGGILLARLPKGQIGDETCRLMGSFVLAAVWQAATARARVPEARRRDATLYVDEAHNFLNLPGSVSDMLAEARGYRLAMVLAHQNLDQMPRETQMALSANCRNKIFFSCAPEDARQLSRHTLPELDEHDLSHMDAFRAAARLVVDGRETPAFTLHTNAPRAAVGKAAAIRRAAAEAAAACSEPVTIEGDDGSGA